MKPGNTQRRFILSAVIALGFFFTSCDEELPELVEGSGVYEFSSATLIDGDVNNTEKTDLVLLNVPLFPPAVEDTLTIPAGESTYTTLFVSKVLASAAPCEDENEDTYTFHINLKNDYKLAFICTSEGNLSEDLGNWILTENTLTMYVSVSFSPIPIPIVLSDIEISETGITGTVNSFPAVKYVLYDDLTPMPLAGPIDGDINNTSPGNLNLQYISIDIELTKVD